MTDARSLSFVEVDLDHCSLTYSVSPCQAFLGVGTGDTWDSGRKDSDVTLSGSNLVATKGTTDGNYSNAFGLLMSSGFRRFSVVATTIVDIHNYEIGVANSSAGVGGTATGYIGRDNNSIGWGADGNVVLGNVIVATIQTYSAGDTLQVAFNGSTRRIWFQNVTTNSNWNNDPDASPFAGTGGIDISAITGDLGMAATFFKATEKVTLPKTPTGTTPCFNSLKTCQDRANYTEEGLTLRFCKDVDYVRSSGIEAIPVMLDDNFTPAEISLGENIGTRSSIAMSFRDHRHSDTGWAAASGNGFDKYLSQRIYDPYSQGTFFGKFRSRHPFLVGRNVRLVRGFLGQTLDEMETHHFILNAFTGPDSNSVYQLSAQDVLRFVTGDASQAPIQSDGFLSADITSGATSLTLHPVGIGSEYATSGYVAIGGTEVVSFTRSGDVLTITRGQFGTSAQAHSSQDRVQTVLVYTAQTPADIAYDLITKYTLVTPDQIPLSDWQLEVQTYLDQTYTAVIAEPNSVENLLNELIKQAGLVLWWDDVAQLLRLQVIRPISTTADVFSMDNILDGTFQVQEQPNKRISEVWTAYAQINPCLPLNQDNNYRSAVVTADLQAESDYTVNSIDKIQSRWIPQFGQAIAAKLNALRISRYRDPPRQFNFEVFRGDGQVVPVLGGGYQLQFWNLQEADGSPSSVPIQITRLEPTPQSYKLQAEEVLFSTDIPVIVGHVVTIDTSTNNFNLRTAHDKLYGAPVAGDTVVCIISSGVIVGASSNGSRAFDVGSWPTGVTITVTNNGTITGAGGNGGRGGGTNGSPGNGQPGGTALYTRQAITFDNTSGQIKGGGGGGGGGAGGLNAGNVTGGGGGGGGGGRAAGSGAGGGNSGPGVSDGDPGSDGSLTSGGDGGNGVVHAGNGGRGGNPGSAGAPGTAATTAGGAGGAAGNGVDGDSHITYTAVGTIVGPRVN